MPAVHKGTIAFGMVSISISLHTATTEFMPRKEGTMQQAVFAGLREDKKPEECIEP